MSENLANKFVLNDYLFLDGLYLSQSEFQNVDKLNKFIANEYLILDKMIENYTTKLGSERKMVNSLFFVV